MAEPVSRWGGTLMFAQKCLPGDASQVGRVFVVFALVGGMITMLATLDVLPLPGDWDARTDIAGAIFIMYVSGVLVLFWAWYHLSRHAAPAPQELDDEALPANVVRLLPVQRTDS